MYKSNTVSLLHKTTLFRAYKCVLYKRLDHSNKMLQTWHGYSLIFELKHCVPTFKYLCFLIHSVYKFLLHPSVSMYIFVF